MSSALHFLSLIFPPKPKWTQADVPDLTGQIIIVTGGNAGIGKETIKTLLEHNAKVYMASRSKARAEAAIAELKEITGKEAIFLELDLSNLANVRKAAEEFLSKESTLNVLYNNAGVMWNPVEEVTSQGYDMQFGTNVVGHFFFTELLIPALLTGVKASGQKSRIVNVSSMGAHMGNLNFDMFRDGPARRKMSTNALYCQSKLGNVVHAEELHRRYGDQGIVATSLHPGVIATDLSKHASSMTQAFMRFWGYPTRLGAVTQLWAGTAPETLEYGGQFLVPWARVGRDPRLAKNPENNKRLYEWLQEQVKNF